MENVLRKRNANSADAFIIFIFRFNTYKYESTANGGKYKEPLVSQVQANFRGIIEIC